MTSCLLNIDLINDFLDRLPLGEVEGIVTRTNELVQAFRLRGLPVIWVRQEFDPDLSDAFAEMREKGIKTAIAGTLGCELHSRLDRATEDIVIIKKRYSAFFGTDLDSRLRRMGVNRLVLTGVNLHACVRTTAIDAYQRDLTVILASQCLGSYDRAHGEMSMTYMHNKIAVAMTNSELLANLQDERQLPSHLHIGQKIGLQLC